MKNHQVEINQFSTVELSTSPQLCFCSVSDVTDIVYAVIYLQTLFESASKIQKLLFVLNVYQTIILKSS